MSFLFFTDFCKKRSEYHCLLADQIMVYTSSIIYDRTTGMVVATGMAPRLSRLSIVQMESVKAVKRHSGRTQTVRFYERNWIGLEGKKENNKRILLIITFTLLLFWALMHTDTVLGIVGTILAVLAPFLLGLCFAFVINVLLRPIEKVWNTLGRNWAGDWVKKLRRPVCLLLSILLIVGIVFVLLFMVGPELKRTAASIVDQFPAYMAQIETWWQELTAFLAVYSIELPQPEWNLNELGSMVQNFFTKNGSDFFGKTLDITTSIFSGVFNVVLGLVFALYVLAQKEKLGGQITKVMQALLPQPRVERLVELSALINRTFTNFVTGQLTEAVIIGGLCFIGMKLFSMPYAPMISVLVGFTALIPVFGAFIGTAVGAFLILMDSPMQALWFILFIIVLQQLEGNLIYPRVVGKSVGLPGIWVLAAVTIGGSLFGVLGILLSVPVCSVLYCVGKQAVNQRLKQKGLDRIED